MEIDQESHYTNALGFGQVIEEGRGRGFGWSVPELWVPGTDYPHISVLLTLTDVITGTLANNLTVPRVAVTIDLRTRILRPPAPGEYVLDGRILRTGESLTVAEATLAAEGDDTPFAASLGTFISSPRPGDVMPEILDSSQQGARRDRPTLTVPFTERVGLEVLEPGITEAVLRPDLTNATSSFQGGVIAVLGEMAAQTLASDRAGTTYVVDDLDVRYLRAARVGPARATATLHQLDDELASAIVEVRDTGMDNRLAAFVTAECRRL